MKKKIIKSAVPVYGAAAVWLLLGIICPGMLLRLWFLLFAAVLSAAAYFVLSRIFRGREVEVQEKADSGDRTVDALIEDARVRLNNLAQNNAEIPDAGISKNLDRMVKAGGGILKALEKDTSQAQAVRRFMNYYLPTSEKLVNNYRLLMETGSDTENISEAMRSVENSLDMIAQAFEKQMDNLYRDKKLDIETDIDVLETMMAADGLTGSSSEN